MRVLLLLLALFLYSCADKFHINGVTMGTTYSITTNKYIDKKIIDNELSRINTIFSNWLPNSEITKFNNAKVNEKIIISRELLELILNSKKIYNNTEQFFDITLGNAINIWGFGSKKITKKPTIKQIQYAQDNSGFANLAIHNNAITKLKDVSLNLSAIAKGYAVDVIANMLTQEGITDFVVEIGGEVKVLGAKTVGIDRLNKPPLVVNLNNEAIATSGNYRNYNTFNNKKFIHIFNPKTMQPSTSNLISVSVIAKSTADADAYATALLAMGKKKAIKISKQHNLKSILIDNNNNIHKINL